MNPDLTYLYNVAKQAKKELNEINKSINNEKKPKKNTIPKKNTTLKKNKKKKNKTRKNLR